MNALRLGESRQLRQGSSGLSAMTATGKMQVGAVGVVEPVGKAEATGCGGRGGEKCRRVRVRWRCGHRSGATGEADEVGGVARWRSPPAWSTPGRSRRGRCGVRRSTGAPVRRRWGSGRPAEPFRLLQTRRASVRPRGGRRAFAPRVVRSASGSRTVGYWWKSRFFNAPPVPGVTRPAHRDAHRSRTPRALSRSRPSRTPARPPVPTRPAARPHAPARPRPHALVRRAPARTRREGRNRRSGPGPRGRCGGVSCGRRPPCTSWRCRRAPSRRRRGRPPAST